MRCQMYKSIVKGCYLLVYRLKKSDKMFGMGISILSLK